MSTINRLKQDQVLRRIEKGAMWPKGQSRKVMTTIELEIEARHRAWLRKRRKKP